MSIIDVLTTREAESQTFTVNTALQDVDVNHIAGANVLRNAKILGSGLSYFSPNDSINILSVGISLPHMFTQGQKQNSLFFYWREETTNNNTSPVELGTDGQVCIPFSDAEFSLGIFLRWPDSSVPQYSAAGFSDSLKKELLATINVIDFASGGSVSMIGVPPTLNGQSFPIRPFVKIEHTIPLS
ncbi:MAG TPA: hypothetical protein VLH56_19670 [Dissulfurispiraceae bacterium]|nr:hypothetical protein [Dissulfurispiraceae bacterium]